MEIKIKENLERNIYSGFIYRRDFNELGMDFRCIGDMHTKQICFNIKSILELKMLKRDISEMLIEWEHKEKET